MSADREHELKVWPPFYAALADGSKTFEVRKDDRGIQSGDLLRLREWQPFEGGAVFSVKVGDYTGRETTARVGYVLRDEDAHEFGVRPGFCVLTLLPAPTRLAATNGHEPKAPPEPLRLGNLDRRILAVVDPVQPGPDVRMQCVGLVREAQRQVAAAENLGSAHPSPHPQGGTETLRARIEALCDEADARRKEYDHIMASHVWTTDLRALLAAAPAPTSPTRPCAIWPHLECACRGGLSGGASTCTRRREAERATPAPTETCRGIGDQHLCTPACAHDQKPVDPPRQSCGCPPIAHRQRHLHPEACAAVEAPPVAGVRDGEDWTAFTETPCEDDIAHDRHVWRGLFPDPRLCPGVPNDFEAAVAARLAECSHLFVGRTCTRCGWTMPAAASEPTPAPTE